jgi:HlyD family secretion protein
MQVWVSVNEADIGNIFVGQVARFTVDAHPGRTFTGAVGKIRLNATMTQNVVTYTVEVHTENPDGALLPYLTANVQFQVAELKDVLLVSNAALRWTPPASFIAPDARTKPMNALKEPSKPGKTPRGKESVWMVDNRFVRPLSVHTGPSDGSQTQIEGDGIEEGMEVAVGQAVNGETKDNTTTNPFTPQMFGNRRQQ